MHCCWKHAKRLLTVRHKCYLSEQSRCVSLKISVEDVHVLCQHATSPEKGIDYVLYDPNLDKIITGNWFPCLPCWGHISSVLQAQSFFAALPQRLAARLQQAQCIPTEGHQWVYPHEALVCQNPQVRHLLADTRLAAVMTLQYAHSGESRLLHVIARTHGQLVAIVIK